MNKIAMTFYFALLLFSYNQNLTAASTTDTDPVLSEAEKEGLILMREEEKLAHDVYMHLYEKWELNAFYNIAQSEWRHTEAIKSLLDQYKIEDPMMDGRGNFSNPDMKELYNTLIEKGEQSLGDALLTGAQIEDLDIADLDKLMKETENEDILWVYNNLNRGSRNHIRSFSGLLADQEANYQPKYISQDRYNDILASTHERGGRGSGAIASSTGKKGKGWRNNKELVSHNKRGQKGKGMKKGKGKRASCQKDGNNSKNKPGRCRS